MMLVVLELVAFAAAPARDRPVAGGALAGAATAAFVVVGAVLNGRRGCAGCPGRVLEEPGGDWFSGRSRNRPSRRVWSSVAASAWTMACTTTTPTTAN
jgi:hypothetical protein